MRHGLAAPRDQRIGLNLALGIEHAQVAQVAMQRGKVRSDRQLQAVPGALAGQLQRRAMTKVLRTLGGLQRGAQRQGQQQAKTKDIHAAGSCSLLVEGSVLRGGKGAK